MEKEKNILDTAAYKKNPFVVPENYFSDFSKNIEEKIAEKDTPKTVSLFDKMRPWMYIAASLLLFAGGLQWYMGLSGTDNTLVENTETTEIVSEETTMLLAYYVDDLMLMDYLISENN